MFHQPTIKLIFFIYDMISLKWLQSIQLFFCKFYLLHVWVKAYVDLLGFFLLNLDVASVDIIE
ncbi:hypothetical protein HanIR_Chr02g0059131 [Helianthus annuus]|nr:hypothetical protein HanIR_Chr02g0059131 [Helianthus annuus]